MTIDREQIISYLARRAERPLKAKELARALDVETQRYAAFKDTLRELEDEGAIYRVRKGRYAVPKKINLAVGRLQVTRAGHGFVIPEDGESDVFVPSSRLGTAYEGDRVVARIERRRRGTNPEGSIVKVLERARTQIVGVFHRSGRYGFLEPEDPKVHRDVFVPPGSEAGARDGDVVVVRITDWGSDHLNPVGEVIEVLGPPGDPGVDILAIVHDHELPPEFPAEVLREAEELAETTRVDDAVEGRDDFRDLLTFTIDPEDAKDHDDAISVEPLDRGRFRVGVHIADVSHFVPEGSALDLEALSRATSVYLVDRVLPMLPHALSGDLCSLRPEADRLTLSVLMEMDGSANVQSVELRPGIIRSRHKLSYDDAQEIMEGKRRVDADLRSALARLRDLTRHLRRRRQGRGGLDFDLPEARIVLNAAGEPVHVQRILRLESHQLIEELMILANESVAALARRRKLPFVYRIHEPPDPARIERLREFVASFGLRLAKNAHRSPKALQKLISAVDGRPEEALVSMLVLRSLKQARYSPSAEGHFGLASDAYTHFTSPIRRYPDLVVHRLVRKAIIDGERIPEEVAGPLGTVSEQSSIRERQAMEAERDSVELKKIEFMERHLGDEFEGTIAGVTSYGLFVLLDDILVEGLVHVSNMDDDYYRFNEETYSLIGESHGRRFRLGDRVRVRVMAVDRVARELDLEPVVAG